MSARRASPTPPKADDHYSRNEPSAHALAIERCVPRQGHNVTLHERCRRAELCSAHSNARCGTTIVGDRMPAMAISRSDHLDLRRDVARRLTIAVAIFCLLT